MTKKMDIKNAPTLKREMPNIADYQSVSAISNEMFGWELSENEVKDHKETYGFIYKCIADNTSNPSEWLGMSSAIGRNVVAAIVQGHESHLLSGEVTIYYPEMGLSPDMQSKFVWMVCRHPQASKIKELRIITRSAWFISDCKSVRVLHLDGLPSKHNSELRIPKSLEKKNEADRIRLVRKDPFLDKSKKAIFFNFAADDKTDTGVYLGEDDQFVYWHNFEGKILRTDHYTMWYALNAVLLDEKQCNAFTAFMNEKEFLYTRAEAREFIRKKFCI